jgi:hypothetical protein
LANAFTIIKNAVSSNSDELAPLLTLFKTVWTFVKDNLAPLLGGAFKIALEGLATLIAGLVTAFSKFVSLLTGIYNGAKKVIDLIKNNPLTNLFGGGVKGASFTETQGIVFEGEDGTGGRTQVNGFQTAGPDAIFRPGADPFTFTGAPLSAYSPGMQAAIMDRERLVAETARLRAAREDAAAARTAATGGLSTADRITVNMGVVGDPESAARTVIDLLNKSQARGTGGAGLLVGAP